MSELHDAIAHARALLTAEAERLWHAAWCGEGRDAACMARVAVNAEAAADALFDVLNAAKSYLDDDEAAAVMFPEPVAPVEVVA
jgi:hypothetical protein